MKKVLKVTGMTCHHCKMAVEKEVGNVDGVISVVAFPKENMVEVEFDETKADLEKIKEAIDEAGYEVVE
ncbi:MULTISPECIES: copper ion binding protein [Calditerrivibrio]|uniref:Mercuric reductase n=1 Tax=Calditerrivibrio nitroreducens TaxID=477976 RepID=A0A2J6WIA1_9BACT|nr:MAG: mercuric reductase [Calditerrivibrio nitroreducens]